MRLFLPCLLLAAGLTAAEPEFPLTADSQPQPGVAQGTLVKGRHTAKPGSVFPGTERDYQLYLPAGFDKTQPAAFMVFQDGLIYQAPTVFDNLIAQKAIPPLVGVFIKPGVVPAANASALPRFNRSYEYDSVTDTYSRFLIDEFLPALEAEHGLRFSPDPNRAAIAGNSSGGICAFMVAWHRPDRFRRVFTGVGTYVGIRGADRLPVLLRKLEPKPLRVFLQSGTGDNNLYCGDWWMANLTMARSLAWAGYEVNHAWGEGGHNAKHASQVFPEALRWLWRDWPTALEVRANPKGESKWKGYDVVGAGAWEVVRKAPASPEAALAQPMTELAALADGSVYVPTAAPEEDVVALVRIEPNGRQQTVQSRIAGRLDGFRAGPDGGLRLFFSARHPDKQARIVDITPSGEVKREIRFGATNNRYDPPYARHVSLTCDAAGRFYFAGGNDALIGRVDAQGDYQYLHGETLDSEVLGSSGGALCLSPDQTLLYLGGHDGWIDCVQLRPDLPLFQHPQHFHLTELPLGPPFEAGLRALCVDANGWLYAATALGIQVCDQAGRVNFILPTPQPAQDLSFGGKDLSELFIACGDTIYKRSTKTRGVVNGQQPPVKPAPPRL